MLKTVYKDGKVVRAVILTKPEVKGESEELEEPASTAHESEMELEIEPDLEPETDMETLPTTAGSEVEVGLEQEVPVSAISARKLR